MCAVQLDGNSSKMGLLGLRQRVSKTMLLIVKSKFPVVNSE